MFPIQEEDQSQSSVDKEAYKNICKQCHSDLKEMKIGVSSGRGFIALPKLNELIEDIEALKTGNFIVIDNWFIIYLNTYIMYQYNLIIP